MGRLFGTDGVRGIANTELTCELAFQLGKAGAYVLSEQGDHIPKSSLERHQVIRGVRKLPGGRCCSSGAIAVCVGVISTPVAFLIRSMVRTPARISIP